MCRNWQRNKYKSKEVFLGMYLLNLSLLSIMSKFASILMTPFIPPFAAVKQHIVINRSEVLDCTCEKFQSCAYCNQKSSMQSANSKN